MSEAVTKEDLKELRESNQELLIVVAKIQVGQESFLGHQMQINEDLKTYTKESNEETRNLLISLKEDCTVRLNKHSEKIDTCEKVEAKINNKLSENKGMFTTILAIVNFLGVALLAIFKKF